MKQLTSADTPGIYTAAGTDTVGIIEISADVHTVIAWLLHEVAEDDDTYPDDEWPGGRINDLSLAIGEPGVLHGTGTIGDVELGTIVTITKLRPRVP